MVSPPPEIPPDDHAFVVMAYGTSPFLRACLESIASQSVRSRVVLTTSTPCPFIADLCEDFALEMRVNPSRIGIAEDWNFALSATTSRAVTLAHQDDVYYPRFLETNLALLSSFSDAVIAFTNYDEIDDAGTPISSKLSRVKHALAQVFLGNRRDVDARGFRKFLSLGNPLPCSSVTFNRPRLGDFSFSDRFQSNLDWDAWLRLASMGHLFARSPERLIGRRHNPLTATSRLIKEGVRHQEDLEMFRRLWPSPLAEVIAGVYRVGY